MLIARIIIAGGVGPESLYCCGGGSSDADCVGEIDPLFGKAECDGMGCRCSEILSGESGYSAVLAYSWNANLFNGDGLKLCIPAGSAETRYMNIQDWTGGTFNVEFNKNTSNSGMPCLLGRIYVNDVEKAPDSQGMFSMNLAQGPLLLYFINNDPSNDCVITITK